MNDPRLPDLQALIWKLITAPEGVEKGVADLEQRGKLPAGEIEKILEGEPPLTATRRLDIYANMYFYRLHDALLEDFPKLAAVLGSAHFHNLVTDYLLAFPSEHWSLTRLGARFADHLDGHALGSEFPFAGDLARLEWARVDVFDAGDAAALQRDRLASLAPEDVDALMLGIIPACQTVRLGWDVLPLWRDLESREAGGAPAASHSAAVEGHAHEPEPPADISPPREGVVAVRAWRQENVVYHRAMDPEEAEAVEAARAAPLTLARLAEVILEAGSAAEGDPSAGGPDASRAPDAPGGGAGEDPVERATRQLACIIDLWLEDGVVREVV